ncbi:hypothetical protein [Tengunoibacter tsumagoiensis]|uniref:Uncharacterized protein n=1 Tax=Tengunoibacter tsumagoiensis TaxID=2014871 RepID=A0A401ZY41_9CHLR|nr:hypothetical protein [Tengunoibacter tsumagoiensis]GCE11759.1 hypothetical protein KTT_16180 [Tengunoibacter tsumagoiensis]
MPDYASFRQRLDAVLRTCDVKQVSEFMIAEGQWDEGTPADPAFAMWLMILTSPALEDLAPQAHRWLMANGHEAEAEGFQRKKKNAQPQKGRSGKQAGRQDSRQRSGAGKPMQAGNKGPGARNRQP